MHPKTKLRIILKSRLLGLFLIAGALAVSVSGCSKGVVLDSSHQIDEKAWNFNEVLTYDVPIQDSTERYNLLLNLRYKKNYPYRNIFFFVDVKSPSQIAYRDTIECILGTPSGYYLGDESDDEVELDLIYKQNIYFPEKGTYKIYIQHAMRDTVLKGFKELGIRLQKYTDNN